MARWTVGGVALACVLAGCSRGDDGDSGDSGDSGDRGRSGGGAGPLQGEAYEIDFLGRETSRYGLEYFAEVRDVRSGGGRRVEVDLVAEGLPDMRRPETSCLLAKDAVAEGDVVRVDAFDLSTDEPGRFAGTLEFVLPEAGRWSFNYSCASDYVTVAILQARSSR